MTAPVLVPAELLHRLITAAEALFRDVNTALEHVDEELDLPAPDLEAVALARGLLAGAETMPYLVDELRDEVILDLTLAVGTATIRRAPTTTPLDVARQAAADAGLDPDIVQQHPAGGLYVRLPRR